MTNLKQRGTNQQIDSRITQRRLIPDIMPIFTFAAPFFRQWNCARTLEKLPRSVALLMLSGQKDEIIPPAHMHQLWEIATNPKPASRTRSSRFFSKLKFKGSGRRKKVDGEPTPQREGRFVEIPQGSHSELVLKRRLVGNRVHS